MLKAHLVSYYFSLVEDDKKDEAYCKDKHPQRTKEKHKRYTGIDSL
jgi:hypothetical protein